jgi:hypothetical protein
LRLVDLGLHVDPVLWIGGLGVLMSLPGAASLRMVRPHINDARTMRRGLVITCAAATVGVIGSATAPGINSGSLAVVLATGALPLTPRYSSNASPPPGPNR